MLLLKFDEEGSGNSSDSDDGVELDEKDGWRVVVKGLIGAQLH